MIASFGDQRTTDFFNGLVNARTRSLPADMVKVAHRKLDMVNAAHVLDDLKVPPGNRLEALKGDLKGKHSIRINGQWRIVFRWADGNAHEVTIADYH